ncbi:general odorant-binding protein 56d-like [Aricia agestis]|uniref:general odorant-binding protein 56d-like n=1 Tax=Aricia agestis TaxID=91739 RepID=UPI001C20AA9C|nr:general odorant-binding protein 56d-like [Aricia agestis]
MKYLVLLCLVVAVSAQNAHLSAAQKERVAKFTIECMKETGVKKEVLAEAKKGNLSDDEGLKKFFLCFFKKADIISPNGQLNMDVALAKLPPGIDKASAAKILNQCKSKSGKDQAETAFNILKCYYSGTKQHIIFD